MGWQKSIVKYNVGDEIKFNNPFYTLAESVGIIVKILKTKDWNKITYVVRYWDQGLTTVHLTEGEIVEKRNPY